MFNVYSADAEDFILVDHVNEISDDDSYDYCEDVVPEHSMQEADPPTENSVDSPLPKDIIFSVPSGLMKDLDEAHAAAKLVKIADADQPNDHISEVEMKSEPQESPETSNETVDEMVDSKEKVQNEKPEPPKGLATAPQEKAPVTMSRTSNKKRRKKLKMMKKAQAALNAAETLSRKTSETQQPEPSNEKTSRRIPQSTTGRSKKAPNLAVACATETLAAYRQELMRNRHAFA